MISTAVLSGLENCHGHGAEGKEHEQDIQQLALGNGPIQIGLAALAASLAFLLRERIELSVDDEPGPQKKSQRAGGPANFSIWRRV